MNKHAKELVAALRSGEYQQCQRQLRDGDTYCCLGVASDLYAKAHKTAGWKPDGFTFYDRRDTNDGWLTDRVMHWLGFDTNDGGFTNSTGVRTSLLSLNDGGVPFNVIADVIESEPEGLFA